MSKIKNKKISDLKFDERNINKASEFGTALLNKSIKEVGLGRSVFTDKNGVLIAGNKTVEAAIKLGFKNMIEVETDGKTLVVVKRTDLDIKTKKGKKAKIFDNTVSKHNYVEDAVVAEAICKEATINPIEYGLDLNDKDDPLNKQKEVTFLAKKKECPKCGHKW